MKYLAKHITTKRYYYLETYSAKEKPVGHLSKGKANKCCAATICIIVLFYIVITKNYAHQNKLIKNCTIFTV